VCLNTAGDVALGQEGSASWFVRGNGFHGAISYLDSLIAVNLFCGGEEDGAYGVFVMIQFMFLNSVHVGFLFALVSANLSDLVFDGRHGDMVVILGGQSGSFRGFWYGHGVAAVFIDGREIGMMRFYLCVGKKRTECVLAGVGWSASGVGILWLWSGRNNFIGG
jgi:hypothetical protein